MRTAEMAPPKTEALKSVGGMTSAEIDYLRHVGRLLDDAQHSGESLLAVAKIVNADGMQLRQYNYDLRKATRLGWKPSLLPHKRPVIKSVKNVFSAKEREFAKDIPAMIEFGIENGFGFYVAVEALTHDFGQIVYAGGLEQAVSCGFKPKSSGWSKMPKELVGVEDEE